MGYFLTNTPTISIDTNPSPGRVLEEKDIKKIEELMQGPIRINKSQSSLILSQMLLNEDVNYEQGLELFKLISADINILKRAYNELLEDEEKNTTVTFAELLIKDGADKTQSLKIEAEIIKRIKAPRHHNQIVGELGTDTLVIADPSEKITLYETVVIKNNKDYSRQKKVIDAYPSNVVVYDSPIAEEPRKFEIIWQSNIKKSVLKTGPDLLEDIKNDLIRDGYVTANRLVNDILPALMNTYIRNGIAEIKTDIETPGFFRNPSSDEIVAVKYDISDPGIDDLKQAIKTLEDLAQWYTGNEVKLATVFKWGLIAPFIYSQKQVGSWTPWLYLYGKARSGKTTLGQMVLYMWETPTKDNDFTGSGFDTVARAGGKLAQSTFPIVINEPAGAFQRVSVSELIKGAIERTVSRGRYEGRRYTNKPSFNPVIFTANQFLPDDDALIRRLWVLSFTHSEKKIEADINRFEKEWQTKNHQKCKFNLLKPMSHAAAMEFIHDESLWDIEWKELANVLITRLYADAGMEPPEWIYQWSKSETMEDMDDEHREDIRIFLLDQINRAYGRVQVIDPETGKTLTEDYNQDIKKTKNFKEKVWTVLNERLIPWMIPTQQKKENYVCLTIGFKKEVQRELKVCQPLAGLAQLMGWYVEPVRLSSNNVQKMINIKLKDFLEFLYPMEAE